MIQPLDLVIGKIVTHAKARCRWCRGEFVLVYSKLPEKEQKAEGIQQWMCLTPACAERQVAQALLWPDDYDGRLRHKSKSPYAWLPTPAQTEMEECAIANVLFGGAAGGSKSYGLRWHLYKWCQLVPGYESLLLRQTFPELESTHLEKMKKECEIFGAVMTGDRKRIMRFPEVDGEQSFIRAGHCESESDMSKHLSTEYDGITIDEASTVAPRANREVSSRARSESTRPLVRARGGGWVRLGSNPGGPAHLYLLEHYIDKNPDPEEFDRYHPEHYHFIHAGIDDNPYLEEDYEEKRLDGLDKDRRKQLRDGDWSAFDGQFFGRFSPSVHIRAIEAR